MDKIIFYNLQNKGIFTFSNFDFKYIKDFPHIFTYQMDLVLDVFSITQRIEGELADFKSLAFDLEKMRENVKNKFYFYPSLGSGQYENIYLIFEIINKDKISISATIKGNSSRAELKLQYEMSISQINNLINQLNIFLYDVNTYYMG